MAPPPSHIRGQKQQQQQQHRSALRVSVIVALLLVSAWSFVTQDSGGGGGGGGGGGRSAAAAASYLVKKQQQRSIAARRTQEVVEEEDAVPESAEVSSSAGGSETLLADDAAELGVENEERPGSLVSQFRESAQEKAREASGLRWRSCPREVGADYIPCLDNVDAINKLRSTKHYEHRERHCPATVTSQEEEDDDEQQLVKQACLVPHPLGYKPPLPWPRSRNEVWYSNVPHTGLISYKADQQWVSKKGDLLVFPGGGTQFRKGAMHYIRYVEKTLAAVAWGRRTRVVLDVGCGVASFGGFLLDRDAVAMSFAPKDEHEAQVQLALERGIPAILAVMGTQQLPFPANVYDAVHCARCRVPWHLDDGRLLLELNRLLRPGGYFIWSATPVYQRAAEDVHIWRETSRLASRMCWKRVARTRDPQTGIGVAIFQKPVDNSCYEQREDNSPPLCDDEESSSSSSPSSSASSSSVAWYTALGSCMSRLRDVTSWPAAWPQRLVAAPSWKWADGKPEEEEFRSDTGEWERRVEEVYVQRMGLQWSGGGIRNVMDMNAHYGGFAAALVGKPVWVMNVVPVAEPDTLPLIFERGLLGIYHDWCESFNTYPRTYDLLHADHLFGTALQQQRSCNMSVVYAEMDRILRPGGWVIFRDTSEAMPHIRSMVKSLHWDVKFTTTTAQDSATTTQEQQQQRQQQPRQYELLAARKTYWRPEATA